MISDRNSEKVFFKNFKNQKLCGIISKPDSKSNKIVILVHGYLSSKDGNSIVSLRDLLTQNKINSFSIDLSGCGESEGDISDQTITTMLNDVESAYLFIKTKRYSEVSLFGSSMAGPSCMFMAIKHPELKKLALKAPVSDIITQRKNKNNNNYFDEAKLKGYFLYENKKGVFKINYSFYEDAKNYIMKNYVHQIKVPTLIIHGDKDISVDISFSKELMMTFPSAKLIIVKNADHELMINGSNNDSNIKFMEWLK